MSEKQKEILEVLAKVIPGMPEEKQSYLLGFGEGIAVMQNRKPEDGPEKEEKTA